jgi:hypothetical protein
MDIAINHSQFISAQKHDRVAPVLCILATLEEVLAICAIDALRTDGSLAQERLGKHLLVTNDDRPWLVAAHGDHVHFAWRHIQTQLRCCLLLFRWCLLLLVASSRLALVVVLLCGGRSAVCGRNLGGWGRGTRL